MAHLNFQRRVLKKPHTLFSARFHIMFPRVWVTTKLGQLFFLGGDLKTQLHWNKYWPTWWKKSASLLDLLDQKQRTNMCMNMTGIWKIISVWSEGQVVWLVQLPGHNLVQLQPKHATINESALKNQWTSTKMDLGGIEIWITTIVWSLAPRGWNF